MGSFKIKRVTSFLPQIILIGFGIGMANYLMNDHLNLLQCVIQSLCTSLIIGYTTILLALNKPSISNRLSPNWKLYIILALIFLGAGTLATEVEHLFRSLIFSTEDFRPLSGGKMYLFNGIISAVLGFSLFMNEQLIQKNQAPVQKVVNESKEYRSEGKNWSHTIDSTSNIPVRQGENILLIPIEEIVYFEAYDNYSFAFDIHGQKKLCDYSLRFLETRLKNQFSRIHRKYLVNRKQIKQIKPHINGRYIIEFSRKELAPITSSKTYANTIRTLIKIN